MMSAHKLAGNSCWESEYIQRLTSSHLMMAIFCKGSSIASLRRAPESRVSEL